MDDDRIHCDAHLAADFLEFSKHDLRVAFDLKDSDANSLLAIRSSRYQAMWFLSNYFNRQNAPLIAAAEAQAIANAAKSPQP